MGITLNKVLTYGAKKRRLPNHIAQLNAERRYERQGFKENKALHPASVPQVKKLGTLQESSNTNTAPTNTNIPMRTQHRGTVSLETYQKMERKASSAIRHAKAAKESEKRYRTQLYTANRRATRTAKALALYKEKFTNLSKALASKVADGEKPLKEQERTSARSENELRCEIAQLK